MATDIASGPSGQVIDHKVDAAGRLPANVKPTHYDLTLVPDLKKCTFTGTVDIAIDILQDSRSITLHSRELTLHDPQIVCHNRDVKVSQVTLDKDAHLAIFALSDMVPSGQKVHLTIPFDGVLGDEGVGIYRSKSVDHAGNEQYILASQMEAIDCRRAFPCFDEPALKATYTTTMIVDKDLTCLANMDVDHVEDADEHRKKWVFKPTPLMSTYLLAFAVGHFNMIETKSFRVPVRVYLPPALDIQHGKFALDLGAKTLEFFEEKLGLPYPLPKMDMIAAPTVMGAMENWGLVWYDERFLALDEQKGDISALQLLVLVVQHELAHQWFGNIVTMDYWNGLWLNEAFATWASIYGNDVLYPEWKLFQMDLADSYTLAFALDSLRTSHPVEVELKSQKDISQIFDDISYAKGSCVLQMIVKYTGLDNFLEGVRRYLKKYQYGNTETKDLWDALTEVSGKDIGAFGGIWTQKIGHPVLTVTEGDDWIKVRQNRFLRSGDVREDEDSTIFPIFLGLRTTAGIDDDLTLEERETTFAKTDDFFKINANHAGFYRTLYEPARLEKLIAAKAQLTPEDKFGLITDAAALATGGYQKTTEALRLIEELSDTSDCIVWKGILKTMSTISAAWIFEDSRVQQDWTLWKRKIIGKKAIETGWKLEKSENPVSQQFKALLFEAAVSVGEPTVVGAALEMFAKFQAGDRSAIDANLLLPVYVAALTHGPSPNEAFDVIREEHRVAPPGTQRTNALKALGSARSPQLIQKTLDLILTDEVSQQEVYFPFFEMCSFADGLRASVEWMKDNFDTLERRLGTGLQLLGSIFAPIVGNLASSAGIEDIRSFFKPRTVDSYRLLLEQGIDEACVKIGWVNRDRAEVAQWLRSKNLG